MLSLPYGEKRLEFEIPEGHPVTVLQGKLESYVPPLSEEELVLAAMNAPIGSKKLSELAKGKRKVVLICSDHTRPVPSRLIVPHMVERNSGHVINIGSVAGDAAYAGGNVYCATKAAVKALSDGLRIDVADTCVRVTNVKPGLVETNFSVTRFRGDRNRADNVYQGVKPLTGDDIADVCFYAASAPPHVQIAEVLVLATHQANGSVISRNNQREETPSK